MKLLRRIGKEVKIYRCRNKCVLYYSQLRAAENRVNLNYCHAGLNKAGVGDDNAAINNLGDELSPIIVEHLLAQKGLSLASPVPKTRHLYAVGSILFFGYQDATVWGSGLLEAPSFVRRLTRGRLLRKLDIRCVRGPRTRAIMKKSGFRCPEVYGDPGCLMPLIYKPEVEKTLEYVVIPHFSMEETVRKQVPAENVVSMMTTDYKAVIDRICAAKKVISSSLHGIILAEAYGVPAVFYQDRPGHLNFKYADWYESTGRTEWATATDLQTAIAMEGSPLPDLSAMQRVLLERFPYDLWE